MLPFCGYNMADDFGHRLNMGKKLSNPPKIFFVNWFKKDERGEFIWPGFRENVRVLKWIIERLEDKVSAKETPIGLIPKLEDLELTGLDISKENLEKLFEVCPKEWVGELSGVEDFYRQFGARLPQELWAQLRELKERLGYRV